MNKASRIIATAAIVLILGSFLWYFFIFHPGSANGGQSITSEEETTKITSTQVTESTMTSLTETSQLSSGSNSLETAASLSVSERSSCSSDPLFDVSFTFIQNNMNINIPSTGPLGGVEVSLYKDGYLFMSQTSDYQDGVALFSGVYQGNYDFTYNTPYYTNPPINGSGVFSVHCQSYSTTTTASVNFDQGGGY